ncbi:hypothetical protein M436DRAFT_86344 [Aureobasidium namibiae CBS 147.97]|uniref:BTB domain-containing protein n=1 Tax=Aureobasidium namibiae CBS 147.97 TaxID=1043004 RepID=A0A074WA27_9PEZI|nr:uncharacterized protein M436DRAFT_86344 [Aureobasidium namibiae CBS 147.97]KEQ68459.1 hypothetical protein M436DRAFT_86344 [Aureobasidium namibiae CBS 147.97]
MALGGLVLTSNGNPAEEADGFPNMKSVYQYQPDGYMINFFNDQRLSDITIIFSGKKILGHKIILATHSSYFQEVLGGSPTVSEINLGIEHDIAATEVFLENMYLLSPYSRTSDPGRSLVFFAEMYLLAKRYGREDEVRVYQNLFSGILEGEPFSNEHIAGVAALCGPDSSRYADTPFPDTAFEELCANIPYLDNKERGTLKKKLEEGSMFKATFLGRFAVEMLDRFLMVYDGKSPPF